MTSTRCARPGTEDRHRPRAGERRRSDEPADVVAAGEPGRLACAGAYRARPDRSLLPQLRAAAGRIVLDIDDTDDPVHGQQELALFNAHYDCTCFQPIHIFDGLSGKPVLSLLRPGKRPSGEEVAKVLRHVIAPHPQALAACRDPGARRQPLLQRARTGAAGGHALRLHHRLCHQLEAAGDRGTLARPVRHAPLEDQARRCAASINCPTRPASGAARASSSPASRRRPWAQTCASSSPISKAAARRSTRRCSARAATPRT